MKEKGKRKLWTGIVFLSAFILWTVLVLYVDVQNLGVNGTKIGLSGFNLYFHR